MLEVAAPHQGDAFFGCAKTLPGALDLRLGRAPLLQARRHTGSALSWLANGETA